MLGLASLSAERLLGVDSALWPWAGPRQASSDWVKVELKSQVSLCWDSV